MAGTFFHRLAYRLAESYLRHYRGLIRYEGHLTRFGAVVDMHTHYDVTRHTIGHIDCAACLSRKAMYDPLFSERVFLEAARLWLDSRIKIAPRTRFDYSQYISALGQFFGKLRLADIHIGHVQEYQKQRATNEGALWKKPAGAVRINHELCALIQVLKRADCWGKFREVYEPLPVSGWRPPRTLTDTEEQRFYQAASSRPEWRMWYAYAVFANNTGLRGCEMRALRIADLDFVSNKVTVCRVLKTKRSLRRVPLVGASRWAGQILLEIASSRGSRLPHQHLFPKRISRSEWNPEESMCATSVNKVWAQMREAAGLPHFRPHDCRHQVNTKLAESGADDYTIQAIIGHQSKQMTEWYSGIREQRKQEAMERAFGCTKIGAQSVQKRPVTA